MIHSDTIPNDLDLQRKIRKQERILLHYDSIWYNLEQQRKIENKDANVRTLALFQTIWKCNEQFENKNGSDTFW